MLLPVLGKNLFIFLNTDFNYVWVEHLLTSFQVNVQKLNNIRKYDFKCQKFLLKSIKLIVNLANWDLFGRGCRIGCFDLVFFGSDRQNFVDVWRFSPNIPAT